MDEYIKQYGSLVILVVCMGSIVDIFQFIWIVRRTYRKVKRSIYNRIRREIVAEYGNAKVGEEG